MSSERLTPDTLQHKESDCSSTKTFFGIFNSLFWLIAIGVFGLAIWQVSGSVESFTTGSQKVSYSMLAISLVAFIVCVIGFLASLSNSCSMAAAYVVIFVLLIAAEICLLISCYALYKTEESVVQLIWRETNPYLIEQTENALECCGLDSWSDTYNSVSDVPEVCRGANGTIYEVGCSSEIIAYFKSAKVHPLLVTVLVSSGLIQMLAFVGGSIFFHKLRTQRKSANLSARSPSCNVVAPIIISPIPEQHLCWQSATSGRDIGVTIDSSKGRRSQGNQALLKVAGVMLED
ncbi:tetraspanin-9-like isoform X2 [Watersipora subatra]|uniref:tetraspanin-9-like isoform X2 n=1 Tax=Watersipora subatra TaxID=2589382 RepID=UPI00355C601F